ncbi:hypothetical protein CXF95_23225 [Paraglaciecola sp. MB-3u-78]|nr:hypothetical protein CXF95_23225 [Paraglaciecola sp. MB-3u-78]
MAKQSTNYISATIKALVFLIYKYRKSHFIRFKFKYTIRLVVNIYCFKTINNNHKTDLIYKKTLIILHY